MFCPMILRRGLTGKDFLYPMSQEDSPLAPPFEMSDNEAGYAFFLAFGF